MRYIKYASLLSLAFIFLTAADVGCCVVSATPVSFGTYDTYNTLDGTGDISVTCDTGVLYAIRMDSGSNSGGSFDRKLHSASGDTMNYNFYRDLARTEIWGDGTNGSFVRTGIGTAATEHFLIYGRIPGAQKVSAGSFNDAITIIIEW